MLKLCREIRNDWRWYRESSGQKSIRTTFLEPGFWITVTYRLGHWAFRNRTPLVGTLARIFYLFCKIIIIVFTGADIRSGARIGKNFLVHTTQGLVIADNVQIGDDCTVNTGVCVVYRANDKGDGVARIGNHVRLGVGAKILGRVTIGDHVIVGANAVVVHNIPAYSIAIGIPARARPLGSHKAEAIDQLVL